MLMKKIYSLIAAALMVAPTFAQVVLVDPEGKEYTDGQPMTIHAEVEAEDGVITDAHCPCPSVKNKGSKDVEVAFTLTPKSLPKGTDVQFCWPDQCEMMLGRPTVTTGSGIVGAGKTMRTQVEWMPGYYDIDEQDYIYYQGNCTIEYKILVGGKVTSTNEVTFVCELPSGISAIQSSSKAGVAYDLQGRLAKASTRGLLIKNGKKCLVR